MILFPWRACALLGTVVVVGGATASITASPLAAQMRETRVFRVPPPGGEVMWTRAADRAVLGVTLATGSVADTAGVIVEAVAPDGPAAKAGFKAGDRITRINGVSLTVAREDAEDLALTGLAQRRLQRVLAKAKPGDEVTVQLRSGAATRTVTVKTVSAADLDRVEERRVMVRDEQGSGAATAAPRGMVGVSISAAGNLRDTLGLFVGSVVTGGPAERAGIIEGERIAAVNGVDVRIPREDVEDVQAVSARTDRFVREVQKAAPGQTVTLRVFGNGRYREVQVTAVRASELPSTGFGVDIGDREIRIRTPQTPRPPRATLGPVPLEDKQVRIFRGSGGDLEFDGVPLQEALDAMRRTLRENLRGLELELRDELPARRAIRRTVTTL